MLESIIFIMLKKNHKQDFEHEELDFPIIEYLLCCLCVSCFFFFTCKRKQLKISGIPQETLLNGLGLSELPRSINGSSSNLHKLACMMIRGIAI